MTGTRTVAALLLATAALCWAGNFVLGRAIHADIPPLTLTFWRWAGAGVVLAPVAVPLLARHRRDLFAIWPLLAALAVTGICLFHVCVYTALQTTTATNAALMAATVPVIMPAFSWLVNREPLALRQAAGILVSLLGVTTIVLRGRPETVVGLEVNPGDLWLLFGAVPVWALYSVLLRRLPADLPRLAVLMAIILLGLVINAPLYAVEVWRLGTIPASTTNLLAIGYVAVFASVLAYLCWNRGVAEIGANTAGLFLHLMPVFATLLAIALLGESVEAYHVAGVVLIAAGIVLTTTGGYRGGGRPRRSS